MAGYPTLNPPNREERGIELFMQTLEEPLVHGYLLMRGPRTMTEAVAAANECLAISDNICEIEDSFPRCQMIKTPSVCLATTTDEVDKIDDPPSRSQTIEIPNECLAYADDKEEVDEPCPQSLMVCTPIENPQISPEDLSKTLSWMTKIATPSDRQFPLSGFLPNIISQLQS